MTDVADLRIRVQSDGVPRASSDLDRLTSSGGKAERATDKLMGTLGKFVSVAAVMAGVAAAAGKLVAVQRQFDVINAGLVTATGSAENAAVAFEAIQDFATETPFSLQQVSEAFTKLVNYGLTPSERALTAYGDMSAALGKDLMMLIEAVADASTGEFERLKEFGVKARKEGDNVSFTFRGITTTVRNESAEIEKYLMELSENNFAGNMASRMDTLDGAISNLGDEWDKMFLNLSQSGVGDAIADGVRLAIDLLGEVNDYLSSGQFEGHLEAMGTAWGPWAEDAAEAAEIVSNAIRDLADWIATEYPEDMQILSDAWSDFPENIRAIVQLATVHVAWFVEEVRSYAQAVQETWDAVMDGFGGKQRDDAIAAWDQRRASNSQNLSESIDMILQERQATIDAASAAVEAADAKRQAWEQEREARRKANEGTDRLAGFRQSGGGASRATDGGDGGETKRRQREFQSLVESLRTEEEALAESYAHRRALVERSSAAESEQRRDLMSRLEEWRAEEEASIREKRDRELDAVRDSLRTEEDAIRESYEKRRQIVADGASLSDEARARLLERLATERDIELAAAEQSRQDRRARLLEDIISDEDMLAMARDRRLAELQSAYDQELILKEEFERAKAALEKKFSDDARRLEADNFVRMMDQYGSTLGALGDMFGQFAQGQGKSAERMFKISKALNMAQAVMGIAAGIAKANAELSYPMNIVEGVRIAAVGAAQIAAISQQRFSGAYDDGGRIPAGQFGIVGERGMELVEGPAQVTNRRDTARMLRDAAEGEGGRGDVNVYIDVSVDARGNAQATTQVAGDQGDAQRAKQFAQLIDLRVRDVIIREQRQGGLLSGNR